MCIYHIFALCCMRSLLYLTEVLFDSQWLTWSEPIPPIHFSLFCYFYNWLCLKLCGSLAILMQSCYTVGRCPKLLEYMLENCLDLQVVFSSKHKLVNGTASSNFWMLLWVVCVRIMYVLCFIVFLFCSIFVSMLIPIVTYRNC